MIEAKNRKTVSIVVSTLNRCKYLKTLLESLCHLDYNAFEVVVVNGPSTDDTDELLSSWSDNIKAGVCSKANLSMSRNIGISMAAGEFVAFIDDDAVPEPEWLDQAIGAFERESIGGVGGPVFDHTGYNYQYFSVSTDRLGHPKFKRDNPCPHNCFPLSYEFPHLAGCNAVYRRSALLEIGGFDEEYQWYLDETDVCLRMVDAGYELCQLSTSFIHHKYAESHIRGHKNVHTYRYPILKSKVYYSNRHGRSYYKQSEIDDDIKAFIDDQRNEITQAISTNTLTDQHLKDFEEHAKEAVIKGRQAADMDQKLITPKLLKLNASPFKQFQTIKCDGVPLVLVFLCENGTSTPENGARCIARNKAMDIAALGHKVHVIVHGCDHNTVDFEQGVWVHRILPCESVMSDKAVDLSIPQGAWNLSKAFLDELDRISTHRNIDIVQAPVANVVGVAASLSGRYRVISSISVNELELTKT